MARARLNILCLVGAVIGIIAAFSAWIPVSFTFWSRGMNLIDAFNQVVSMPNSDFWLPIVLCLIGAIVAFISPLGGTMQIVGVPLFISAFASDTDGKLPSGIGPYLALVGAVIVLVSLVYPIGVGYGDKPAGTLGRLLSISPGDHLPQPPESDQQSSHAESERTRRRLLGQVLGWIIVVVGVTTILLGLLPRYYPALGMYLIGGFLLYSGAAVVYMLRKKKGGSDPASIPV